MSFSLIKRFLELEAASGIILFAAALLGLLLENSPLSHIFVSAFSTNLFTAHNHLPASLQGIINEGLMSVFFLLITLEIKRELLIGELNSRKKAALPVIAAIGGMIVPAFIYIAINFSHPHYLSGWAIPMATDVAFSLAVLTLLGSKIPPALKIFLLALALIDDLGAIIIIALFYTNQFSLWWLFIGIVCILFLILFNYLRFNKFLPYAIIGTILWFCLTFAGIHPTLAGVFVAITIPLNSPRKSLLRDLEIQLHPWVAYGILPLFALVNAGFPISALTVSNIFSPISLGIIFGLFVGKQLGIFLASWLSAKLNITNLPNQIKWRHIYGVAILGGIGFTMSLYIDSLAFPAAETQIHLITNFAVVFGSLISGIVGYLILRIWCGR